MIDLSLDLRDFERAAKAIGAARDQVPFALSQALNEAAKVTWSYLIENTWPRHVEVRDRNFMRNALLTEFANKRNLTVAITNTGSAGGRAHLALHNKGGTKQARGRLAIPTKNVRRGPKGVVASQRPGVLKRAVVKGNLIFQAVGKGKNARLRLMYKLQPTARIKPDVPFSADFATVIRREIVRSFGPAMMKAMRTAR